MSESQRTTQAQIQSLRKLVREYYLHQKEEGRLRGVMEVKKDNTPKKNARQCNEEMLAVISNRLNDEEAYVDGLEKMISKEVHKHPLWTEFLEGVKGCGEIMAAVMLTEINIEVATTVSKIWQFAGCNPGMVYGQKYKKKANGDTVSANGRPVKYVTEDLVRGDKKTPGFVRPYNQFLKDKMLGVLAGCFHKSGSQYLVYYRNYHHRLESMNWGNDSKNPQDKNLPKAGHQHLASNRYMIKMFIRDLYEAWRTLEGLPVRGPYQEEYLGHKHEGKNLCSAT